MMMTVTGMKGPSTEISFLIIGRINPWENIQLNDGFYRQLKTEMVRGWSEEPQKARVIGKTGWQVELIYLALPNDERIK